MFAVLSVVTIGKNYLNNCLKLNDTRKKKRVILESDINFKMVHFSQ